MKKIISMLAAAVMFVTVGVTPTATSAQETMEVLTSTSTTSEQAYSKYDINKDGKINVFDFVLMRREVVNTPSGPVYNVAELVKLRKWLIGMSDTLEETTTTKTTTTTSTTSTTTTSKPTATSTSTTSKTTTSTTTTTTDTITSSTTTRSDVIVIEDEFNAQPESIEKLHEGLSKAEIFRVNEKGLIFYTPEGVYTSFLGNYRQKQKAHYLLLEDVWELCGAKFLIFRDGPGKQIFVIPYYISRYVVLTESVDTARDAQRLFRFYEKGHKDVFDELLRDSLDAVVDYKGGMIIGYEKDSMPAVQVIAHGNTNIYFLFNDYKEGDELIYERVFMDDVLVQIFANENGYSMVYTKIS